MTDFAALLPPRLAPPAALPSRGGPDPIRYAAQRRRHRSATQAVSAASVAGLAFAGLAVLTPPGGGHAIEAAPGAKPPVATRSATPPQIAAGAGSRPLTVRPTQRPTATAPTASPVASPTATAQRVQPPLRPVGDVVDPYTDVSRTRIGDRPAEECTVVTAPSNPQPICLRAQAPDSARSGAPTDLALEVCAPARDVTLTFADDEEAYAYIEDRDSGMRWRSRWRPAGVARHTADVAAGTCLLYTFHWDGLASDGEPLPPGQYTVRGGVSLADAPFLYGADSKSITVT